MFGFFRKRSKQNKNMAVRDSLAEQGDDGRRPRHVLHYAYPAKKGGSAPKHEIRRILVGIADVRFTDGPENLGLVFEHTREVASPEFDALTDHFESLLATRGWEYDGWECDVVRGEDR